MPTTVKTVKLLWWHQGTRFVLFRLFLLLTLNRNIQPGEECLVRYSVSQSYRRSAAGGEGGGGLPQPKHDATPAASGPQSSSQCVQQKQAAPQPKGSTQASKTDPARTGAAAGKKAIKGTQKDEFDITASSEESELDGEGGATPAASGPPRSSKKRAAPQPKHETEHAASSAPNSATDCHCTTKCVGRCINAPLPQGTTRIKKTPSNFY